MPEIHLDASTTNARVIIDANAGESKILSWRTDNTPRWALRCEGNDNDNLVLRNYTDAGVVISSMVVFNRATGNATFLYGVSMSSLNVTSSATASAFFGRGDSITSITPSNLKAGTLGATVIASSVAATTVGAKNTCGSASISCSFDVDIDGRITRVSSATISAGEANTYTSSKTFTAGVGVSQGDFKVGTSTLVVTNGNVGISTAVPKTPLQVGGNATGLYFDGPQQFIGFNTYFDGAAWQHGTATSSGSALAFGASGELYVRQFAAGAGSGEYALTVSSTHFLGVNFGGAGGTPQYPLTVTGGGYVSGSVGIGAPPACSSCVLQVAGGASVTGNLSVNTKVAISTTVSGNGSLRVRAGTGLGGGSVPIVLYSIANTTSSIATAGYMDFYKYTLPANTLANDGDQLFLVCLASHTTASFSKDLMLLFAGSSIADGASTGTTQIWKLEGRLIRSNTTKFNSHIARARDATFSSSYSYQTAFDPTIDNEIICRGKGGGTAGDAQGMHMLVEYIPAP